MQQAFAATDNATHFFEGGVTAYNLLQKWRLLPVYEVHGQSCNCVSLRVAIEMAKGVQKLFNTAWGIGIMGYATPIPGAVDELFAHMAIVYKGEVVLFCLPKIGNREGGCEKKGHPKSMYSPIQGTALLIFCTTVASAFVILLLGAGGMSKLKQQFI